MGSFTAIVLHALIVQAHAKEPMDDAMDKLMTTWLTSCSVV